MSQETPPPPPGGTVPYSTTPAGGYEGPPPSKDDTNMAMLIYILGIITGFIGPLIIWLIKKNDSPFINDQGKEVLNFQITAIIAYFVAFLSIFILIGIVLVPAVIICYLVFLILGAVKVSKGQAYRFPFALRLLK